MQPQSLIQLAGSGNLATVEDEWMKLLESAGTPAKVARYAGTLKTLVDKGKEDEAGALAWAAFETLATRFDPHEAIGAVGPLLMAVPNNTELRQQAAQLYRKAHADRAGLDALLETAGLEGGRPIRRALRTVDVCLAVHPGSYVTARDGTGAATIEAIDDADWTLRYSDGHATRTLDAVHFADTFVPARASDFLVLRQFDRAGLARKLHDDPTEVIVTLLKTHRHRLDSDELESILVPEVLPAAEWKKWFTKARAALKHVPQVVIEGRAPYYLSYDPARDSVEAQTLARFEAARTADDRWGVLDRYVRDCRQHKHAPDEELLTRFSNRFRADARRRIDAGAKIALRDALLAARCAALTGADDALDLPAELLREREDVLDMVALIDDAGLENEAFDALQRARPDEWRRIVVDVFPSRDLAVCEHLAGRLIETGLALDDFTPIVDRILASPLQCGEALAWLWNGPAHEDRITRLPLLTILMRMFGLLADMRRDDRVDPLLVKRRVARVRSVLSARRYERFKACLRDVDPSMALALKAQVPRLDALGRIVCEELLKLIGQQFPGLHARPEVVPWEREDVLFVARAGMRKRRAEIDEHINVKMKENARAIGEAAAKGDLSENSEYKFALEERDLLRGRLAMMQDEMARAKVIEPRDVPTDHVGVGSSVRLHQVGDGRSVELAIVGPWTSDVDRHRYNYKTPLAQLILGKRVGDQVELSLGSESGVYEIESIGNAVEDVS